MRTEDPEIDRKVDLAALKNVLYTFVKKNTAIGYCQNFDLIIGHLMRYLSEEETFWVFCLLIESILPIDYYSSMIGALVPQD